MVYVKARPHVYKAISMMSSLDISCTWTFNSFLYLSMKWISIIWTETNQRVPAEAGSPLLNSYLIAHLSLSLSRCLVRSKVKPCLLPWIVLLILSDSHRVSGMPRLHLGLHGRQMKCCGMRKALRIPPLLRLTFSAHENVCWPQCIIPCRVIVERHAHKKIKK